MAGSSNFQLFDPNNTLALSDSDYQSSARRLNGVVPGIADPSLHNKLFIQLSCMVYALGQMLAAANETVSDVNPTALILSLKTALQARSNTLTFPIAPGTSSAQAHGLGTQPTSVQAFLRCITPEYGYSVNQELPISPGYDVYTVNSGGNTSPVVRQNQSIATDSTNITVVFASVGPGGAANYTVANRTAGSIGNDIVITNANWNLVVRVRA